jgi:hypothetical protein
LNPYREASSYVMPDIAEVLMHAAMMSCHDDRKTTGMDDQDAWKKITVMVVLVATMTKDTRSKASPL